MIYPTLIRYGFDETGRNPDNYVKDEYRELADKRFRAIVPRNGVFYTEGFTITDRATGQPLVRGNDYVFAELHQSLSLRIGKEIVGVVIVTNPLISPNVSISYQCVGGDFSVDSATTESLLVKTSTNDVSDSWYDIENRPLTFTPSPHLHDLGDVDNMEVLIFGLERLRNAVLWAESNSIESLMYYAMTIIDNLTAKLILRVQTEYMALVIKYKNEFNKAFIGLGKVQNLPVATLDDAKNVFGDELVTVNPVDDRYVSTEALSTYKEMLYSVLVTSELTHLGKTYATSVQPTLVG